MTSFPLNYDNTGVTVELRKIVESGVDVWAFDYPSYYEGEEKTAFEQKVLDHYWFRQIGQETVGRWVHYFRTRMREIMPYYIQLYESQEVMANLDDPFGTVDIVETFEQETTGNTTGTSTSENTATNHDSSTRKFSNTPQGSIENLDKYLTEANVETSDGTTGATSTGTSTGTENSTVRHTFTKKGSQGVTTYGHDMLELRQTFLNIDQMIIKELNDLFLQVY